MRSRERALARAGRASILLLMLVSPLLFAASALALPTPPSCAVTIEPLAQTAHVSRTQGDTMEFRGTVNVVTGSASPRSLDILAVASNGWATTIAPSNENISDGETVPFNASIAVPPEASATTRATLAVTASFLAVPGFPSTEVTCGANAQVNVAQYFDVDADSSRLRVEVEGGPNGVVASVLAHNLGNGRDTFTLSVAETERLLLEDQGLFGTFPQPVNIEADAQTNITFSINATSNALPGTYNFTVVLRSTLSPQAAQDTLVFVVVVKPSILQTLIPSFTTAIMIGAVLAALMGVVVGRRHLKRRRAARDARAQLQKVLRMRREGGEGAVGLDEGADYGGAAEQADPGGVSGALAGGELSGGYAVEDSQSAPAVALAETKHRVRVKARPRE